MRNSYRIKKARFYAKKWHRAPIISKPYILKMHRLVIRKYFPSWCGYSITDWRVQTDLDKKHIEIRLDTTEINDAVTSLLNLWDNISVENEQDDNVIKAEFHAIIQAVTKHLALYTPWAPPEIVIKW